MDERACRNLYEAVVENDRQNLVYLFCQADGGYSLLSAYEKQGNSRREVNGT